MFNPLGFVYIHEKTTSLIENSILCSHWTATKIKEKIIGVRFCKCKSTLAMFMCCSLRTAPDTPRRTRCRRRSTSWTRCRRANPSPCQGRIVTARSARGCCRRMGRSKRALLRRRSRNYGWVASRDRQSAVAAYSYLSSYSYICLPRILVDYMYFRKSDEVKICIIRTLSHCAVVVWTSLQWRQRLYVVIVVNFDVNPKTYVRRVRDPILDSRLLTRCLTTLQKLSNPWKPQTFKFGVTKVNFPVLGEVTLHV